MRSGTVVLLLLLSWAVAHAAPSISGPELIVEAPDSYSKLAGTLRALDRERLGDVTRLVGLEEPGPPIRVILAPEGSDLARVPPWVSGYAYSEDSVVVLLPARSPSYPDSSVEDLLRHEVAHVLVARAAGGQPLPRWFQEGMAMMAGRSWGLGDRSRLTVSLLAGEEVTLAQLDQRFSGDSGAVQRAYAVAGAFVRDLFDRHGPEVAAEILAGVGRGLPFEAAFAEATGTSLAAAETAFWKRQSFWYRWVPVLTSSVTLWMGITLLALWAIRRRRARDAELRRMWDEEEERRLAQAAPVLDSAPRVDPETGEWVN